MLVNLGYYSQLSKQGINIVLYIAGAILIETFLCFGIIQYNQSKMVELINAQKQLEIIENKNHMYKEVVKHEKNRQILIHDIKNHLLVIDSLCEQDDRDGIHRYVSTLLDKEMLRGIAKYNKLDILNYILNYYCRLFSENDITYNIDIARVDVAFMREIDITALFSNLLENAYEAVLYSNEARFIDVYAYTEHRGDTVISIKNSCVRKPLDNEAGFPITLKKDKSRHGYGMQSIQNVINTYDGFLHKEYDEQNKEYKISILFHKELEI